MAVEPYVYYCEGCRDSSEGDIPDYWAVEGTSIRYASKVGMGPLFPAPAFWCPKCLYVPAYLRPDYADRTRIFKGVK